MYVPLAKCDLLGLATMNSDSDLYNRESIVLRAESGYHPQCVSTVT